ncbi:hypothetical protein BGZ60DRAFT_407425 [Tricladium varicosporioides]|nr:hypothetical protein BGZ60DRAFT_407425 [Hymenoscyphus varicosporioides]
MKNGLCKHHIQHTESFTIIDIATQPTKADAMSSSPDPLNDPSTFCSPSKTRRSTKTRQSLPLQGSSPTKQTFELDVGDRISPQKIRVTVEAGKSDTGNIYRDYVNIEDDSPSMLHAPRNHRRERTTTTTIPLKGLEDSESGLQVVPTPKRGRGRPRKSLATPVLMKKRGRLSTPSSKSNGRRSSIGAVEEENDIEAFDTGNGADPSRGKAESRSRSRKGSKKSTKEPMASEKPRIITTKKTRGRKKSVVHESLSHPEDIENDVDGEVSNLEEVLEPVVDSIPIELGSLSGYSTLRSTASVGDGMSNIVIARFSPGNETPRHTGWSSPRIIDASEQLRSRNSIVARSHERNNGSNVDQYEDDDEDFEDEDEGPPPNVDEDAGYEDEDADGFGELREFDTILESEGFSMISVDSVPSLREHMSSPAIQEQGIAPKKPLQNKSLLSVHGMDANHDDSFSSVPEEILAAATPRRKVLLQSPLQENIRKEDEARMAAPASNARVAELLSAHQSAVDDSFSSIEPEVLEAATPARSFPKSRQLAAIINQDEDYDDSFSAIPEEVLDAATPARPTLLKTSLDKTLNESDKSQNLRPEKNLAPRCVSPRMLTPEETPSPPHDADNLQVSQSTDKSSRKTLATDKTRQPGNNSSLIHSQMPSSPPSVAPRRYTYTAHLRQNRQLHLDVAATPSIVFSSPTLPPPLHQVKEQPANLNKLSDAERPTLSPIARAGRVLQDVIVPSSSSRSRSQSLGSPFKSPATERKSSSILRDPQSPNSQDRRAMPLPKLNLNNNLAVFPAQEARWARPSSQEDPFSNESPASHERSRVTLPNQKYSLGLPEQRQLSDPRISTVRADFGSIRSEDDMSWQAEGEIQMDDPTTSMVNNVNSSANMQNQKSSSNMNVPLGQSSETDWDRQLVAERKAVSKEIESSGNAIVISSDSNYESRRSIDEDDEDFGLLLETMNSSSPLPVSSEQQLQQQSKDASERPRRSKIPSPWRKNSKRLIYSDELSQYSAMQSSFAGDIVDETVPKPVTVRRILTDQIDDEASEDMDLSGWQIPQKSNFQPRVRESANLDLSALLGASPPKQLPVLSGSSRNTSAQLEKRPGRSQSNEKINVEQLPVTSRQESQTFTPIPQKLDFRPRSRSVTSEKSVNPSTRTNLGLFAGISNMISLEAAEPPFSSPKPLTPSSPSRHNIPLSNTTSAVEPSSPDFNDCSISTSSNTEKENRDVTHRNLKWTQTIPLMTTDRTPPLISPTKSCLRSPMKTPSHISDARNLSPSKAVAFVSSSPLPSSPPHGSLSSTTWSKNHWHLLDSILQAWKPQDTGDSSDDKVDVNSGGNGGRRRRRNSTRVISKLLGRTVRSEGDSMVMEQWHLEVVDEFRGHVSGWEEKAIAMRVFSLIKGAERRRRGEVGRKAKNENE